MTLGSWPQAVPFDPEGGAVSRVWEEILAAGGSPRAILLISGEAARYAGWSARAALALADSLASSRRVLLVDLHLEQPELNGLALSPDAEGVVDLILYGASLERVALASPEHAFQLVPVGGPVPDAEAVILDRAWTRVLREAEQNDLTLLLYVPWRARGLDTLVRRIGAALFLGGHADARVAAGYLPPEAPIAAVLSPGTPRTTPAAQTAGDGAGAPAVASVSAGPPPQPATGERRLWPWAAGAAIAIGVLLAFLFLFQRDQGAEASAPPPAATPAPPPQPQGQPLPYAVAIEAHPDMGTASRRVASLRQQVEQVGFFLAPVLVDSTLYFRVMAGPLPDSASAAATMSRLVDAGHKASASDWDIRAAPLSFELDVYEAREQAETRVLELAAQDIPAYALAVPYSTGGVRFHLYCGAYAGPAEADIMRQLLAEAGIDATLVQRIGRPIP
jgi:hypothetical protein